MPMRQRVVRRGDPAHAEGRTRAFGMALSAQQSERSAAAARSSSPWRRKMPASDVECVLRTWRWAIPQPVSRADPPDGVGMPVRHSPGGCRRQREYCTYRRRPARALAQELDQNWATFAGTRAMASQSDRRSSRPARAAIGVHRKPAHAHSVSLSGADSCLARACRRQHSRRTCGCGGDLAASRQAFPSRVSALDGAQHLSGRWASRHRPASNGAGKTMPST